MGEPLEKMGRTQEKIEKLSTSSCNLDIIAYMKKRTLFSIIAVAVAAIASYVFYKKRKANQG